LIRDPPFGAATAWAEADRLRRISGRSAGPR